MRCVSFGIQKLLVLVPETGCRDNPKMTDHRHVSVYAIRLEVSWKGAEEELVEDTTLLHIEIVLHFIVAPAVLR